MPTERTGASSRRLEYDPVRSLRREFFGQQRYEDSPASDKRRLDAARQRGSGAVAEDAGAGSVGVADDRLARLQGAQARQSSCDQVSACSHVADGMLGHFFFIRCELYCVTLLEGM